MSALAQRIHQARRSASLTQAQLAEGVGVNRSAVAQWERKDGPRPTSGNLARIAVTTRVNFDWLATGRGKSRTADYQPEETPALELRFFAHSDLEEQLLLGFRTMTVQRQKALLTLLWPKHE